MSVVDTRDELVPLHTDFDLVWRGCDRDQVRAYVERVETELRLLAVDRDAATRRADALAAQLEAARAEIRELTERLDRVSRTPVDPATLPDRVRSMVELAHAEAEEITTRATAVAEQTRAAAHAEAERMRRRAEHLVAELDRRQAEMATEHRELMAGAHRSVQVLSEEAERRRRELDEQAARLRAQEQADFEVAMRARRADGAREVAAARAEAERVVREAGEHARSIVAQAREQVDRLHGYRDRVLATLRAAQETLAAAEPLLEPSVEELPSAA